MQQIELHVKDMNDNMYAVYVSDANVKIIDSWRAKGNDCKKHLIDEINKHAPNAFGIRTLKSILHEWKAHNVLYRWNYQPERTRDVDIDQHISIFHRICFFILSLFKE